MSLKPVMIYNPAAAKGAAGKNLPKIQAMLQERGFEYDLILTEGPGHAEELGRNAAKEGRSMVVAAGGDGTINETINGLMYAQTNGSGRPVLAVLPIGRGNDFAFGTGIPQDIALACDTLVAGQRRRIDIGCVTGGDYPQGRYFGNGVGLGFDTVVGFEAAKIRWLHGAASYLVAVIKTIFLYAHAPVYEVVFDGVTRRGPYLMVSIMNGQRMGGAFMMAPQGNPEDGILNLCLASEVSQALILPLAVTFMSGKQGNHRAVEMARARQITIHAVEGTIPAHADGETLCTAGQDLAIQLVPGALEIIAQSTGRPA